MHDLDRLLEHDARRDIEDKAVGEERGVQRGKGLIAVLDSASSAASTRSGRVSIAC